MEICGCFLFRNDLQMVGFVHIYLAGGQGNVNKQPGLSVFYQPAIVGG